jgi:hypothetical protein
MSATTSTARPSRETAEQDGGILLLIDAQTGPAPLEHVAFARPRRSGMGPYPGAARLFVGLSHDRRLEVLILLVFFVLGVIIIVVGVSRRHLFLHCLR